MPPYVGLQVVLQRSDSYLFNHDYIELKNKIAKISDSKLTSFFRKINGFIPFLFETR
jgi:hypothetical protein